ncbi:HNH endonuclease signature motif containing protein [Leptospira andrefontaineae]|uniref:HNH endonuclease n=1 Tax=Leptospira andrefontaineae TaxID=2484976 RepID=A0A4R9H8Y6_9LEPT|nr:HNH endonuclease signature motif containing protein [Leptospira andrefontaineae]TGK42469.1 HNH endonuclease [Leptospira andrefontaineae]
MSWTDDVIQKVWEKGKEASPNDPKDWRKDECTAWMKRNEYGNRNSKYGWEIDHINPKGSDELSNLRPLQWENNNDKSDGRLKCNIVSNGNQNVVKN